MKLILTLLIILCPLIGFAQSNKQSQLLDINGVWADSSSSAIQNAVAVISEENGKVVVVHYLEWNGKKFVEHGIGERRGNSISYTAKVTLPIKGWATEGRHEFKLSADGLALRGTFKDNLGNEGPIVFKRIR